MVYKGEWKDDMRHGYGRQEFYDGSVFEGEWEWNRQKFGTYMWTDGSEYVGEFDGPFLEGKGTMKLDNEVISGEWHQSLLHGKGTRKLATGDFYSGTWTHGKLSGYGEYISKDESYSGTFLDNKESGRGKKVNYGEGYVYEGEFREGLFEGYGKQEFQIGDLYTGQFRKGHRHGKGIFVYANGDEYEGEWEHNLQSGYGSLTLKYTTQYGQALNAVYKGRFKGGLFHGVGVFQVEDGYKYEGEYVNGVREGEGKLIVPVEDVKH